MDKKPHSMEDLLMELLIENGPEAILAVFTAAYNMGMKVERGRFIGAEHYERAEGRRAFANGYKSKRIDTSAGTATLSVPKTAGHGDTPFYPKALQRGRRCTQAVMAAAARMYLKGVSTRDVEDVLAEMGIEGMSATQVSNATKKLDGELEAWRTRALAETRYLILDARYEKVRIDGVVRDATILTAIGVVPDGDDPSVGRRRVLGVSVALSEAVVHWREFLDSLVARGMRGVEFVVSDDHAGLGAARRAALPGATWQRCQCHLQRNAFHRAPTAPVRKRIGAELREVWNAQGIEQAQAALDELVEAYRPRHPKFADWLEHNAPEGLAVFSLPEAHRRKMRTTNGIERAIQQELKRRTRKIRVFPDVDSLMRVAAGLLVEVDEEWLTGKAYVKWEREDD